MARSVCLFGLSADPPTGEQGHVGIVKALCQLEEWDEIWVLPVFQHTFAEKRARMAPFDDRLRMCQLAFDGCGSDSKTVVLVSDAERKSWAFAVQGLAEADRHKATIGTASLLTYLCSEYPTTLFHFCLGADAYNDLGKWKESSRVLELLQGRLVVFDRENTMASNHTPTTEISVRRIKVDHLGSVSSSQVRECRELKVLESLVVPSVLQYMKEHGLYALGNG